VYSLLSFSLHFLIYRRCKCCTRRHIKSVFESRVLAQELKKAAINREKTRERRKRTDRAGQRKWETMVVLKLCGENGVSSVDKGKRVVQ